MPSIGRRGALRTVGSGLVFALTGCAGSRSERAAHTTRNTTTTTRTTSATAEDPPGPARWRAELDQPAGTPVYGDGRVIVGTDTGIVAFSADSGAKLWSHGFEQDVRDGPIVEGDTVYVVTGEYATGGTPTMNALAVDTGARRWRFRHDAPSDSRARLSLFGATDDGVYFGSSDDVRKSTGETLYAFAHDGTKRWTGEIGDPKEGTVTENGVYVASIGRLDAYGSDGTRRWQFAPGADVSAPVVANETAYVVAGTSNEPRSLYALDAVRGSQAWVFDAWDVSTTAISSDSGRVHVGGAHVSQLDATDGSETWRTDGPSHLLGRSPISHKSLFAGGNGVAAYDVRDGAKRWTVEPQGDSDGFLKVVAVTRRTVFVASGDRRLEARAVSDSSKRWALSGDVNGPALGSDSVFATEGRSLLAYARG